MKSLIPGFKDVVRDWHSTSRESSESDASRDIEVKEEKVNTT